jgi:hypothetical protein
MTGDVAVPREDFYPRNPYGVRLKPEPDTYPFLPISIHAIHTEYDSEKTRIVHTYTSQNYVFLLLFYVFLPMNSIFFQYIVAIRYQYTLFSLLSRCEFPGGFHVSFTFAPAQISFCPYLIFLRFNVLISSTLLFKSPPFSTLPASPYPHHHNVHFPNYDIDHIQPHEQVLH